jgi:ATP-binding protein involved in chromosome partitioning
MSLSAERVNQVLATVIDPNTGKDLVSSRSARNVKVDGTRVSLDV